MSSAHYQALREALYKNTFRQVDGNPWPTAQLLKGGVLGQAQLRPPAADGQALLPPEQVELWATAMWQQREELSDLDADALDALSSLWLNQARTVQDRAVADVDGLLALRGIKPKGKGGGRRAGYEPEQREEMLRALSHIQNLWINIAEVEVYEETGGRRGRAPVRQTIQSRAFVITDRVGQLQMNGYMDVRKFIFRPGEVFAHFLLGPGHQTALLSAMALKYDPYRQTWEKRLARYLSWQWRTKARNSDYLRPYRVATLLDAVGKDLDERRPAVTRERLEKALDLLQRDGVIAAWQYDRWEEGLARQRGWGHTWLEATLLIEPPEAVKEQYQPLERQRQPAPRAALPAGLGERIKRRRKDLGLNQKEAGELLGVTQAYISMLERGKIGGDRLSAAFRQRLETWLAAEGSGG
jgi:DNA-binding XRE family transcriptional regulator